MVASIAMRRPKPPLVIGAAVVTLAAAVAAIAWARSRDDAPRSTIDADSIVLLGDSITFGGDWARLLPGVAVANEGHPGYTTEQLLPVAERVAAATPAAVLVMTGTNDIRDGHPPAWTVARLERLLDVIAGRSPDTVIVVQSVLPRAEKASEIEDTNAAIRASVEARGLRFLDLHEEFDDGSGGLRATETSDGWHLTDAGYRRWADHLGPLLRELGV